MQVGTTPPWIRLLRLGALLSLAFGACRAADLSPLPPIGLPTSQGVASWYGRAHEGRKTASGAVFRRQELTAAHRTAPFGTQYLVVYQDQAVAVTVIDRGPYIRRRGRYSRDLDLSEAAARSLGMTAAGVARVSYREIDYPGPEELAPERLQPQDPAALASLE
jgi:rare lipoprotein A (peptidoglycan hydrolase)